MKKMNTGIIMMLFFFSLVVLSANVEAAYFSDDFESGLGNWSVSGSDWALIDTDSVSATHSVTDSPDANYSANDNSTITLAGTIDLSGATSPVLNY